MVECSAWYSPRAHTHSHTLAYTRIHPHTRGPQPVETRAGPCLNTRWALGVFPAGPNDSGNTLNGKSPPFSLSLSLLVFVLLHTLEVS